MSTYTVTTNFANKDTLPTGSADKVIKGSEFTTEFNNIATAVNSKADNSDLVTLQAEVDALGGGGEGDYVSITDPDYVKLTQVNVTATEINRLSGVSSNVQAQLTSLQQQIIHLTDLVLGGVK